MKKITMHLSRTLNALLVGFGFSVVMVCIWIWVVQITTSLLDESRHPSNGQAVMDSVQFNLDGTPFLSGYHYACQPNIANESVHKSLEGETLPFTTSRRWLGGACFSQRGENQGISWPERMWIFPSRKDGINYLWYFIHDGQAHGKAFFVGYDYETRQRIGFLGTMGFQEAEIPPEGMFPVTLSNGSLTSCIVGEIPWINHYIYMNEQSFGSGSNNNFYIHAENRIYRIDLKSASVQKVYESLSEPVVSIIDYSMLLGVDTQSERCLAIRTASRVILLDPEGNETFQAKLPERIAHAKSFSIYKVSDDHLIATTETITTKRSALVHQGDFPPGTGDLLEENGDRDGDYRVQIRQVGITHFHPDGSTTSFSQIMFPIQRHSRANQWTMGIIWLLACPVLSDGILLLTPFVLLLQGIPIKEGFDAFWDDFSQNFEIISFIAFFLFSHLFPLIWCLFAWRKTKSFRLSGCEQRYWVGFVYICGLCGYVGFLGHRKWPVMEKCPGCGGSTPVTHPNCLHCGIRLPAPELRGIEIFEEASHEGVA